MILEVTQPPWHIWCQRDPLPLGQALGDSGLLFHLTDGKPFPGVS